MNNGLTFQRGLRVGNVKLAQEVGFCKCWALSKREVLALARKSTTEFIIILDMAISFLFYCCFSLFSVELKC